MSVEEIKSYEGPSLSDRLLYSIKGLLLNYKRSLIFFIPFLLVGLFLIFKFSLLKSKAERDYISAKAAYSKWDKSEKLDTIHLQTLKTVLKRRPELAPSYEGLVIQKLLANSETSQSKIHIESILKRIGKHSSFYTKFSKASLLIAQKDYEKALNKAISLKEEMIADKSFWETQGSHQFGSTLFVFNLLRIAMLNQNLGLKEKELVAWKELKRYAKWEPIENSTLPLDLNSKSIDKFLAHLTDHNLSLKDYIRHRESKLIAEVKSR